ncbi:hypothetical protein [uncultured Williamsia sp.]|uniref:hypothetical protein n=1 Tax=uncultured Williamsia sp. TaxID=259311 RepID=UPI00260BD4BF|nr:hypothetical protein [uncultured Williamsia sp.]
MRDPSMLHALVLMNLLFASALWAMLRPSIVAAVICVVVAIAWVIWNKPIEGSILLTLTPVHGVTESDLLSVAAVLVAAWTVLRVRSRR